MTQETIQELLERENRARRFVSDHSRGPGGVGNYTPGDTNLALVIQVVEGRSTMTKVGENGKKATRAKTRIVEQDGNIFFVPGGIGDNVAIDDALPFIPAGKRKNLVNALARNKRRRNKNLQEET